MLDLLPFLCGACGCPYNNFTTEAVLESRHQLMNYVRKIEILYGSESALMCQNFCLF